MDQRAGVVSPPPSPPARRDPWRSLGLEPVLRLGGWALRALGGRLWLALRSPFFPRERRERLRSDWAARSAGTLIAVLGRLKGPFVKAGQFAAHRHDLLPARMAEPLARLRDRVPPLPLEAIRPVVEAELGGSLSALFAEFDPLPLGAASVAQVHRARLPNGDEVAVKVQYPWLESALPADLTVVRALLFLGRRLAHQSPLDSRRLVAEFEKGLREELDFEREAATAAEIAANLRDDPQILVPRVIPSHSSRRVLSMEYHPAVRVTDREALAQLGTTPRAVLEVVARAYAKQMFVDGLFHADPHPGNLFVLRGNDAPERPRVLFVDFGLSRRLPSDLRRELRLGAHALIQRDLDAFAGGMNRMGMIAPGCEPGVRDALQRMFQRIQAEGGALSLRGGRVLSLKDEAVALLRETPGLQLPDDLLLFAKTLSMVFALGQELDPDTDLMQLSLPYLLRFLGSTD